MSARSQQMLLAMGGGVANILFAGSAGDAADATVYTIAGVAIGTAAGNRYVICGIVGTGTSATTLSSATIGGVSATIIAQASNSTVTTALVIALVPTGTTATVVATFSGGKARCNVITWAATNLNSPTATNTYSDTSATGDTLSVPMDIQAGGFGVAIFGDNTTWTSGVWVGLTEDVDVAGADSVPRTGASANFSTTQTGLTVSLTSTPTPSIPALVAAAFR